MTDPRVTDTIKRFYQDRRLAHQSLFAHRHPDGTPPFHLEIIDLWHSSLPQILTMAFRGAGKSTLAEEAMIILACLRKFKNGIILGENETRATERLTAIKNEFETNDYLEQLFGPMVGPTWQERKIVLANGVVIQAFGRGQSLRGSKHLQYRPDLAFGDDMEDDEAVVTPEARRKFQNWFMKVVVPSLAPGYKFRIAGTPLDPEAWLMKLQASRDWITRIYPIEHRSPQTGARTATWPARFPLAKIDKTKAEFYELGAGQEYMQEYMCESTDPQSRAFTVDMFKVDPLVTRTWQPVFAFYDPARTVRATSARTGVAVWSWINNRLIVWDAYGGFMKPDEMIQDIFRINDLYDPVSIGVEETGLNEFILQPLRHEQARRGVTIPLRPMNAPKGKMDFIKSLQPFFKAKEVIFAKELSELQKELLAFPTGLIDVPNALAYALRMRPGAPIYDGFSILNIAEDIRLSRDQLWAALNATQQYTSAALVQHTNGVMNVTHDWLREGDPGSVLSDIVADIGVAAGRPVQFFAGPQHFGLVDTVGLRAAARKVPVAVNRAGAFINGREHLRETFRRTIRGGPAFRVSTQARWTLKALSGGYCRPMTKHGTLSDFAEEGPYKVLMEGLESFAALSVVTRPDDSDLNVQYTPTGQRYISSLPR